MIDIKEKLEEVLALEEKEQHTGDCTLEIMTLYSFHDDVEFANTEKEFHSFFEQFYRELCEVLGQPVHRGKGPNIDNNVVFPQKYFFEHQSALYCSWWKYKDVEVMLMITGHDANSLQYIQIAASRAELDE